MPNLGLAHWLRTLSNRLLVKIVEIQGIFTSHYDGYAVMKGPNCVREKTSGKFLLRGHRILAFDMFEQASTRRHAEEYFSIVRLRLC